LYNQTLHTIIIVNELSSHSCFFISFGIMINSDKMKFYSEGEYTMSIIKSTTFYIAQCEQLPEVLTQGATIEEAISNAKDAIKLILDTQKEETF